jgi:hypothetical protein
MQFDFAVMAERCVRSDFECRRGFGFENGHSGYLEK